jgi:hypothetical protein
MKINLIKRNLLTEIRAHLSKKEISLIVGPRQVGKTTLMLLLKEELEKKGEKVAFLSLDRDSDKYFFSSQDNLISKIKLEIGERGYVFIDEIQRMKDAGIFLKGIYDLNLPYKFVISGSGSLELKEKIHESLVGRKRMFELNPVSFEEFVDFKTNYRYEGRIKQFFELEKEKTYNFLKEYLNFGGYPRVILENEIKEKRIIVDEIFHSYLEKDISYLLKIENPEIFGDLIKILAAQIGQLTNYSKIASDLNISIQTCKRYIWYAEKTFVIKRLTPYFKNVRKEITKSPVIYFYDIGLRNYALGLFGNLYVSLHMSFVFENFVFNILKEKIKLSAATLHFWRTKDKAEVDFIVKIADNIFPIEAKYKMFKRPEVEKSLRSFIEKYRPNKAFIVNLNFKDVLKIGQTKVIFLPFWELESELKESEWLNN